MKRIGIAAMLLAMLWMLSGCFVSPDPTLEPLEITDGDVPFGTAQPLVTAEPTPTPEPTPSPTVDTWVNSDQSTWEDWARDVLPTATPKTAATAAPDASSWLTSSSDYNAGYPVLRLGSSGTDVSDLQARLTELRYYSGVIDGMYSTEMQQAVKDFQEKNGLTVDGIAGRQTQDLLYSSQAQAKVISVTEGTESYLLLKTGSSGLEVRKLQARLAELGYYSGGTDGIYGQSTVDAVKAFQRANGLSADGQAGTQTQTKLYSASAVFASSPVTTANPDATRTLSIGMTGNDVYALQERLIELRYLNGVADGVFGEETRTALMAFQKNNNLTIDGTAGATTLKRLFGSAKAATGSTPTPVPANATVLHEGDSGEAVYNMQARLFELGYFTGRIDGRFGSDTTEAVKAFQSANGLAVDGVPGRTTFNLLYGNNAVAASSATPTPAPAVEQETAAVQPDVTTVLRRGDKGDAVVTLQSALRRLGYISSQPDGQFGSETENALKAFQRANGLTADGIAGKGTLSILYSSDAMASSGGSGANASYATPTPKPNTDIILQWQSEGSDVLQYQARLVELGYLTSKNVTGTFNQPTVNATKAFQEMNGLKVDGAAGPQSLKLIYSDDALNADGVRVGDLIGQVDASPEENLKLGMTGEQVRLLQSRLAALGYLSASFSSGVYDTETEKAMRQFQAANGLSPDGQAGTQTQSLLYSSSARSAAALTLSASNQSRENSEVRLNGANQSSLAGGGILCSGGGKLYYADAGNDGMLSAQDGNYIRHLGTDRPRELHCTNNRLYYVAEDSGQDCIIRMNADGTGREVLCRAGVIVQFLLHDGVMYYLGENNTVKERTLSGEERVLMENVISFSLDVEKGRLLCVQPDSVVAYTLSTEEREDIFIGSAQQALCCAEAVLILTEGRIVRVLNHNIASLSNQGATYVGACKDRIIEMTEDGIYTFDINGENRRQILSGSYSCVAVSGTTLYAGDRNGYTAKVSL